ncbi:MAG: D-glycero-beta-D-manno-heptose 1-phosphate adenylyltransferase [Bacteroidetes bacterium]|nr:D-glycero-beta-D-manno-heptose 1-phosphate adenylyltransferase [Bacteroidota bacterium]
MDKLQWITNKITDLPTLVHRVNGWRTLGKQMVFTNGVFDILHRGHIDYLAKAASLGNILIVGVNSDASVKRLKGNERPINSQDDRTFHLASLLCVDAVCVFEDDTPQKLIENLSPNILAKGGDYTVETIVGAEFVLKNGGKVEVIPFVKGYSTTSFIERIRS